MDVDRIQSCLRSIIVLLLLNLFFVAVVGSQVQDLQGRVPCLPVAPDVFLPPKEDTSDFLRRRFFPNLSEKILSLPVSQVLLKHTTNSHRTGFPYLITHREKPPIILEHVANFDGVLHDLGDGIPQPMLDHHLFPSPRLMVRIDHANIDHGLVVQSATLAPEFGPLRLFQVAGTKVFRLDHQQGMKMRMRVTDPATGDFHTPHPTNGGKDLQLSQTLPPLTHHFKGEAQ